MNINPKNFTLVELRSILERLGASSYRANQIFEWTLKKRAFSPSMMKNIPKDVRAFLDDDLCTLKMVDRQKDVDGTIKYAFLTYDDFIIETVLMDYQNSTSICISSQAGCKMGCKFCATGQQGLDRDLQPAELIDQLFLAEKLSEKSISNIVVMGMGEPFDNYDNLKVFLENITSCDACDFSRRSITVSTCGLLANMDDFVECFPQVGLAISLHASNNQTRKALMPIAKKHCLEDIISWGDSYFAKTKRRITYEYALIRGVNDTIECAKELSKILKDKNVHVNLIVLNKVDGCEYMGSDDYDMRHFKKSLEDDKINVTLRRSLGANIKAACGQLKNSYNLNVMDVIARDEMSKIKLSTSKKTKKGEER